MTFGSADMEAGGGGERRHGQQEEQSSDERRARFAEDWGCCACAGLFLGPNPMVARYLYALIFLVTNLLAWTLRDYGDSALAELQRAYIPIPPPRALFARMLCYVPTDKVSSQVVDR
jgi:serine incorporator 1/3